MQRTNHRRWRHRLSACKTDLSWTGFTLVENLVAILVLALAVAAVASTMVYVRTMFLGASSRNELQQLVENDLSAVRQANERLTCKTGDCELAASDTSRSSYFPDIGSDGSVSSDASIAISKINNLCRGLGSDGSLTAASSDGGFSLELNSRLPQTDSRISRNMIREARGQRYMLVYTEAASGKFLRAVSLVPTTVSWCPNDLP